jgi:predicted Holliday junction resolvase-like endonuclease
MKHIMWIVALSAVLSMSPAVTHLRAQAAPSAADLKKEAELQKKAAKAKEEWAKAEEKIKNLEKELEEARADAVKKRDASDRAQRDRDAFRLPTATQ